MHVANTRAPAYTHTHAHAQEDPSRGVHPLVLMEETAGAKLTAKVENDMHCESSPPPPPPPHTHARTHTPPPDTHGNRNGTRGARGQQFLK